MFVFAILSPCCWEWSVIVFFPLVHLHYTTNHISLYFFLWCITPDYCCLVDGSVDLGSVVASFFQFLLPWFLPLSSLSSHSHVCYLWLIVMSIFLHFCSTLTLLIDVSLFSVELGQTHFSPFPLHSKGTALGKHGSLLLIIERV